MLGLNVGVNSGTNKHWECKKCCLLVFGNIIMWSFQMSPAPGCSNIGYSIQWISITEIKYAIRWIVIYPSDSTIQRLNNQTQIMRCVHECDKNKQTDKQTNTETGVNSLRQTVILKFIY